MIDNIIKMFYKWLKLTPLKLDGIEVTPILTDDLHIDFECNPIQDVSYYEWAISLAVELHFERFLKLSGALNRLNRNTLNEGVSRFNVIIDKQIHLSSKDLSRIDDACDSLKTMIFTPGHNLFTSDINTELYAIEPDGEGINVVLGIEFLKPKINGVPTNNPNELIQSVKPKFTFHNELEDFEYQFLNHITSIIWNGPKSLFSQDAMYVGNKVSYHYKGKNVWGFED